MDKVLNKHEPFDMIVIGAGISGLAMAFEAQLAGNKVLVLEKENRCGGCFHSEVMPNTGSNDGEIFWLEMGTHTCFNSYGRLLNILGRLEMSDQMQGREKLSYRMLVNNKLVSIASRLSFMELLTHVWRLFSLKKEGKSIADHYSALIGPSNYSSVFRHAFNAVVCQPADQMPADMLFRKRPRDKSVKRSYTFAEGLARIIAALEQRLEVRTGQDIHAIHRHAAGYVVETEAGVYASDKLVCATPAPATARLLAQVHADIAEQLGWVNEVEIESVGIVVCKETLTLPPAAGIIAVDDDFYSAISRDYVAHPHLRGFTFHFKPGLLSDEEKLQRICTVLGVETSDLQYVFHKINRLPAPEVGHHQLIEEIDAMLANHPLALVGNYFDGVAVEDCLERVEKEWARFSAMA
ncbi:MAG: FAD-dependent oxidoreductase [Mariprofundus sp.]|nr:FAD-dependent oxidoreductase [Mariprofundus sp.]